MLEGWLVYTTVDYEKNKAFAALLQSHAQAQGIHLTVQRREQLQLGSDGAKLTLQSETGEGLPSFIINRSRDARLAKQCALMGIKLFNSFEVTDLCNDKVKTQQYVNAKGIPTVASYFFDTHYDTVEKVALRYPIVVKTVDGHGGIQVWKAANHLQLARLIEASKVRYLVLQTMCGTPGVDIRVFVVGNKILAAIKRCSSTDFRSNYSLGGETSVYEVDNVLQTYVEHIVETLPCDCVGIDFMLDEQGGYLFNEIEDVVGSRSLYQHTTVDIAACYIAHIAAVLAQEGIQK